MEEMTLKILIESTDYKLALKLIVHTDKLSRILKCIESCKYECDKLLIYKERLERELKSIKKELKDEN